MEGLRLKWTLTWGLLSSSLIIFIAVPAFGTRSSHLLGGDYNDPTPVPSVPIPNPSPDKPPPASRVKATGTRSSHLLGGDYDPTPVPSVPIPNPSPDNPPPASRVEAIGNHHVGMNDYPDPGANPGHEPFPPPLASMHN